MIPTLAKAQTSSSLVDILNFALTLEYIEAEFYNQGLAAGSLLTGSIRTQIGQIAKHENAHVALLRNSISPIGTPRNKPSSFDFSAGGAFPDWNTNLATFLTLAQAFEDTGVRAYKGQAAMPSLVANDAVLTVALQIHSVEARHAAIIRHLRNLDGWIQGGDGGSGVLAVEGSTYKGEEITTQGGVSLPSLASLSGINGVNTISVAAAFDEPLSMADVVAIADPFYVD
jgi:rubrerythrin